MPAYPTPTIKEIKLDLLRRVLQEFKRWPKGMYICSTLDRMFRERRFNITIDEVEARRARLIADLNRAHSELASYISRKLGVHAYYHTWLGARSLEFRRMGPNQQLAAAHQGRIQWIQHMIELVEKQK